MAKLHLPRRRWRKILLAVSMVVLLVIVGGIIAVRSVYESNLRPLSSSQKSQLFTIPSGTSVKEISTMLEEAKLIRTAWAFEWYVRNKNLRDDLLAGTYSLRPNLSIPQVTEVLTQGKVATTLVTILPGQRVDQIREALINKYGFSPADVDIALDPNNYTDHPALVDKPKGANLEGYIYPETFQKTADSKPQTIIRASLEEMQQQLTPELRAGIVRQGLTVHQGVILASIIEQEVGKPEDKDKVAQIFLRRLKESKALESDATAPYGAVLAGQSPSITYDSPYNTYKNPGLTPTPISNVSASSLEAVAKPATTDFLYFVSGDDGKTYFSRTLEEHEALTREHCKKLCNL